MPFKAILWPTDGSPAALGALQTAVEMARTYQARLYGLQVVNPVPLLAQSGTGFAPSGPVPFNVPLYEKELIRAARKNLEKTMADKVPEKVDKAAEVKVGEPHDAIIDFVREKKVELIVMATHGRTGFNRLLLGSVAEKVIRNSPVPVLAVPAGEEEEQT